MSGKKEKYLCIRKTAASMAISVVPLFLDILEQWGILGKVKHNKTLKEFTFPNGSKIMCQGIDDPEKIKSVSGVTNIWVEECTNLEEADLKQLTLRLRGEHAEGASIIMSFNPISETHWLKRMFYDDKDRTNTNFHLSTYKDNKFLDSEFSKELEGYIKSDPFYHGIYCLGNWGKVKTNTEVFRNFEEQKHIEQLEYNPNIPLHVSFDFNVNPYSTILVFQQDGNRLNMIDELCIRGLHLRESCEEFVRRYTGHQSPVYIYGDASGRSKDSLKERGTNAYTLIQNYLSEFNLMVKVPPSNPSIDQRVRWINQLLYNDSIKIRFNQDCKESITEFQYMPFGADGKPSKAKITKNINGQKLTYEQYSHISDAFSYAITQIFNSEYMSFMSGGRNTFKPLASKKFNSNSF
jgi:phage terminase large subunit